MESSSQYILKKLYNNIESDISNFQISQKLRNEKVLFNDYFYYEKGKYEQINLQLKNNYFLITKYKKENYFRIRCYIIIKYIEHFLIHFKQYKFIELYNDCDPSDYMHKYIKTDNLDIINDILNFFKIINQ